MKKLKILLMLSLLLCGCTMQPKVENQKFETEDAMPLETIKQEEKIEDAASQPEVTPQMDEQLQTELEKKAEPEPIPEVDKRPQSEPEKKKETEVQPQIEQKKETESKEEPQVTSEPEIESEQQPQTEEEQVQESPEQLDMEQLGEWYMSNEEYDEMVSNSEVGVEND